MGDSGTSALLSTIVEHCRNNGIPIVQCFKRRKLARVFKRGQSMSCLTVMKGASTVNEEWWSLQPQLDLFCRSHLASPSTCIVC